MHIANQCYSRVTVTHLKRSCRLSNRELGHLISHCGTCSRVLRKRGITRVNGLISVKGDPGRVEFNFRYLFIGIPFTARMETMKAMMKGCY